MFITSKKKQHQKNPVNNNDSDIEDEKPLTNSKNRQQQQEMTAKKMRKLNNIEMSLTDFLFGQVSSTSDNAISIDSITDSAKVMVNKKKRSREHDDNDSEQEDDDEEEEEDALVEQLNDEDLFMVDKHQDDKNNNNNNNDWMKKITRSQLDKLQQEQDDEQKKKLQQKVFISLKPVWKDDFSEQIYIQVDTSDDFDEQENLGEISKSGQNEHNRAIIQSFISRRDYEKAEELSDGQALITGSQYEDRMRQLFQQLHKTPKWAKLAIEQVTIEESDERVVVEERFKVQEGSNAIGANENDFGAFSTERVFDTSKQITKGELEFNIVADVNEQERPSEVISIRFHPHSNLMAALGSDKTVRLFQVSHDKSTLIDRIVATDDTNVLINNKRRKKRRKDLNSNFETGGAAISGMEFTVDGTELIMTSPNTRLFFVCDMTTGDSRVVGNLTTRGGGMHKGTKKGRATHLDDSLLPIIRCSPDNEIIAIASANNCVELLSRQTKFSIGQLMMSDAVRSMQFSNDSQTLYTATKGGKVYLWDVKEQRPRHVFQDEGSIDTTCVAIFNSPTRSRLACGSSNGVVNVYDLDTIVGSNNRHPKPINTIMNLTTSVSHIQFSRDGKLLSIASKEKPNAIRMVHAESMSVYPHFPYKASTSTVHQFTVGDLHFNANSQYLALAAGNRIRLFQFPYYAHHYAM